MAATTYKWAVKTSNKLEQAVKLLKIYCILNNINPSETGLIVCAFIMVYGLNDKVREAMIRGGVLGTQTSIRNELHTLRRMGLLEGIGKNTKISSKILDPNIPSLTPQTLIIVNLDNR